MIHEDWAGSGNRGFLLDLSYYGSENTEYGNQLQLPVRKRFTTSLSLSFCDAIPSLNVFCKGFTNQLRPAIFFSRLSPYWMINEARRYSKPSWRSERLPPQPVPHSTTSVTWSSSSNSSSTIFPAFEGLSDFPECEIRHRRLSE
jgi:hypothetical protein